jgi:hypothetical protein
VESAFRLVRRLAVGEVVICPGPSSLTEYFQLADVETVWDDLRQMNPKSLEPVELDVLEDNFISSLCSH